MSTVLIDTDIASFIFKGSNYADPYSPLLSGQELAISFMTIAELFQWCIVVFDTNFLLSAASVDKRANTFYKYHIDTRNQK